MPDKEKKVIIFIVEGPSDEGAIGSIVKEYFSSSEVKFHVIHGDITARGSVNSDTIIKRINDCMEDVKTKYRYTDEDILKVIHLSDLDGAFVTAENVIQKKSGPTVYYTDHIETSNVGSLIKRNQLKSELLYKLSATGKINEVPYRIYYMSCNLEHVLFNELREFSSEEKWEYSDTFAERFEGKPEEFIEFLGKNQVAVYGTYKETWDFIQEGENSLNRFTNFQLAFQG